MSNNNIWDIINLKNDNIKKRKIINSKQKLIKYNTKNKKYISYPKTLPYVSNYKFNQPLKSISYSNELIQSLNPDLWIDASDLSSIQRDHNNNIFKILDKSIYNNDLGQHVAEYQPKYHNGGILFNSHQYLICNNLNQSINNMSIFIVLKQYNQSLNQGILSGFLSENSNANDNTNPNGFSFYGSNNKFNYQFMSNNISINDNLVILYGSGTNSIVAYSSDGINWTQNQSLQNIMTQVYDIKWNGLMWLAGGVTSNTQSQYKLAYSLDGISWSANPIANQFYNYDGNIKNIEWSGSIWVITGNYANLSFSLFIMYSSDGFNWVPIPYIQLFGDTQYTSIKFSGKIWLLSSTSTNDQDCFLGYSYDLFNWNPCTNVNFMQAVNTFDYNGLLWVCAGSNSSGNYSLGYSYDGIDWVESNSSLLELCNIIKSNGSIWIAGGQNTSLAYSYDGITWVESPSASLIFMVNTLSWTGSIWIAGGFGTNNLLYSDDGITWTPNQIDFLPVSSSAVFEIASKNIPYFNTSIEYGVYEIVINNNVGSMYNNGRLINTNTFSGLQNFTDLILGARWIDGDARNFFNGEIYEIIILNSAAVDDDTRYQIENYLIDKWNTTQFSRTPPLSNIYTWLDASSKYNFTLDQNNNVLSWNDKNNKLNFIQNISKYYPKFDKNKVIFNNSYLSMNDSEGLDLNNFSLFYIVEELNNTNNANLLKCTDGFELTTTPAENFLIGVGSASAIYSNNGINWSKSESLSSLFTTINKIAYNGKMWVAGGEGIDSSLAYSYDGINWTANGLVSYLNLFTEVNALACNDFIWLAGGIHSGGVTRLAYSYDGINWVSSVSGPNLFINISDFAWNGNTWVISCELNTNQVGYSFDGINWNVSENGIECNQCYGLSTNGAMFIVGSNKSGTYSNVLGYSFDGDIWDTSASANSIFNSVKCIAWNKSMWVAGGNTLGYSYDGITWSASANSLFSSYKSIAWNGNLWITCGAAGGELAYSSDGINWTQASIDNNILINSIASKKILQFIIEKTDKFTVGVGANGKIIYSYDGINYTETVPLKVTGSSYTWNSEMVALNETAAGGEVVRYTPDGINWSKQATNLVGYDMNSVKWTGSKWIAVGSGYISSPDGVNWSSITSMTNLLGGNRAQCVCVGNGVIVVISRPNIVIYSTDGGTIWYQSTSGSNKLNNSDYPVKNLVFGNNMFVCGGNGMIMYSYDGITWELCNTSGVNWSTVTVRCLTWNGSFFLGCGYIYISPFVPIVGIFIKSTDGINWSRHYTNIDSGLNIGADICWAKNIFVCLVLEAIVYSYDGNTWVIVSNTPSNPITTGAYSVTYNGRFVVYGLRYSQTWITYSNDGITWSGSAYIYDGHTEYSYWTRDIESKNVRPFTYDNLIPINWSCIGYNGSMWIAGGSTASSGHIGYSYDGITWNEIESVRTIFTSNVTGITWNGSRWVVVGNTTTGGIIAYSLDSIYWYVSDDYSIFTDTCSAVAASDKLFVCGGNAVGYSDIYGNIWEISSSGSAIFTDSCNCLVWNGTIWLAGGYGTSSVKLAYSSDGITWTESTSGSNLFSAIPTSFAWNGTYWIGVSGDSSVPGTVGVVALSVDGITWIESVSGSALFPTGVSNITWNGSIWIATDNNIIGYSYDGITWVENTSINVPIINFASRRALPYYNASANKNTGGGINLKINDINLNYVDSELLLPKKLYEYNIKDGIGTVYINGVEKGSADFGVLNTTNNFRLGFNISNTDTFVIGCCLDKNSLLISKMVYSYDNGVTWFAPESINSLFDACLYTGYNGSRWLVFAQNTNNVIAYSDDGINWTESQNISSILTSVYGIDFYDSKWYIYGYYDPGFASIGRVIYSTDNGITWSIATSAASLFDIVVQQIIYNGSIWVACGQSTNRLAYSSDNITWTASDSGNTIFTVNCNKIEYNNNMWVAGGEDGKLAYSNNGIDWVQITSPLAGTITSIKSNGNIWVAGADNLGYSSNGTDWYVSQSVNDLDIEDIISICWNGSVWMATYQPGIVIYSTDGISWIIQKSEYYISIIKSNYILPSPAPPPNTDTVVIASGGIRGYTNNALVYSYNGLTWIPSTSANNIFDTCYASGYSGSRWVVIGTYDYYLLTAYSDDGINWTQSQDVASMIDYVNGLGIGFYNSIWYIWGTKPNITFTGSVIYSNDNGLTWVAATTLPSLFTNVGGDAGSVNQIIYNGSIWVACGKISNRLAYSYDNITWNESLSGNNIFTYECNKIEYNNNMWVAGGNSSKLAYSYNGIDWIQTTSPFTNNNPIIDIKSNGNLWLATDLSYIGYSYNGIDWKSSELIPNTYIICWTGAIWIIGSVSDACTYSTDGINWVKPSRNTPIFNERIYSITAKYPLSSNVNVNMHELIILKDTASFNQRNQIYSYLSGKWNLPISISAPAPNPTIWLDANNSDSITLDGSNNILTWNDLSTNNYTVTINGTKPMLANYGTGRGALFNGSTDVNINIPQLTGSSNTIFLVFSADDRNANNNNRLISFSNGTNDYSNNSFNINSNTNTGTLKYNSTNNYYQTINFNGSLYIYTIQNNNNNVNIYINNYLVNSFTNSQNYNYTKLDLGSLFGNSNNWWGCIGEFIYYNTSIDINGTINYLANKWIINLQSPVINEYIPRLTSLPINKYIPLTNIFENNTNYVSISDTPDKSQVLNFNINVPVKDTLPNQLTLISSDTVYLTPNQKNILYNLIEFTDLGNIRLPTLTYDNDYFAFTNSGIYDVTITDSIGLDVTITPSQTIYFTNISGSYTDTPTFQGFNCTLNRYDNIIANSFTLYIDGWSNNLSYIRFLYVNYINNDFIIAGPIYFNQRYQAIFDLYIAPGIYNLIISDTESTGNIINFAISTPVTIYASLYRNKKINSYNFLLNNTNHTGSYSINLENLLNDYEISDLYVNAFLNNSFLIKDEFIQIAHVPTSEIKDNIISFDYSFDISQDYYFIITDSPKLDGSININLMNNINKLELSIDINQTYGFTNTNNVYTLTLSNNESFDLTLYEKIWNIYYNNIFVTQAILNKNQTIIFSYNPTIPINSMFSISTSKNLMLTKINKPITISNISFKIEHNKLNLIGWNSNITIPTLYIFDTNSNKLLTTVDTQNPVINYKFPRAQNYLTISDTNDMTGIINYVIKEPLYIEAQLNIKIKQLNTDNWGYLNTSKSFSFILDTYYDDISVNYSDYYSTISIYYANNPDNNDLTLIDTVLVVNNQVNFTFTPTETNIYFYFNDTRSSEYIFFNRDELVFTLNNDILTSNININSKLYVYSNQIYLTDVINSRINLPKLNIGTYYLSISNIDKNGIKTINDINVNINEPIIIDKVNLEINKNYGFIDKNNNYLISTNGNIYYSTEITNDINKLIKISNVNSFNFDNSELKLSHVYFYNSSLERTNLINFYDKSLITFTLDHYDNKISKFRLIANKWDSVLNNIVLNIYIENTNYNPIPVTLDINNNIYSGLFNIDFNLLDTGKYNIIVSSPDINYKISELLVVNKYVVKNSTNITSKIIKTITGKLDDINNHSIKLDSNYDNIELNNSSIIIKHSIVDNIINFSYDSGFESNVTFNIVSSVTKEIYEIINATYL
jgi:hypothetical protein